MVEIRFGRQIKEAIMYIRVKGSAERGRMYLDEHEYKCGRVRAPDGTTEQCESCGLELGKATARDGGFPRFRREVQCYCGHAYEVFES